MPLLGLALNYTPFGSRLGACASRAVRVRDLACCGRVYAARLVSEVERFVVVVEGWGQWL